MMNPILQSLINKHFAQNTPLPEELSSFLEELNLSLEAQHSSSVQKMVEQSEIDLEVILDNLPFGVTLIAKDKTILHANKSALETMGYNHLSELTGHICHDSLCPAAKGECPIIDLNQQVDRSERILITKDKTKVPILKSVTPITFSGQEVLLEAFVDISDRRKVQTEREQAFNRRGWLAENVNALLKKMASADNTKNLYKTLVEELASSFEFSRAQLLIYNPVANNLRVTAVAGVNATMPLAQAAIVPLNRGIIGKSAESRRSLTASGPDINYNDYPELISKDIQSEIALPLVIGQDLHGVLDLQSDRPGQFDKDSVLFLDMIATQTSFFIQNIQFRDEMQDQMDELSILQRMTTTEGWKTFSNLSSMSSSRYVYDQSKQDTVPVNEQTSQQPPSALIKPLEIRGQTIGALGISTDSEDELTAEEKLLLESVSSEVAEALERARLFETSQRSAAELAVLNEMGNSLSQAVNEETILKNIYTYTSQLMDAPQFFVAIYDKEDETISFPYVNMHGVQVTDGHPDAHQWLPRPVGTGLTGYIIKNQQPILLDNQAEEKLAEMGLPFMRFGSETQSWLGVPMIIGRRVLGVISVQSEETPNLYNQHHLDLLTTIAYQAAIAINNTRLLTQQQLRAEQEHLVRTVTDKIRRGTDAANIMQVALEELSSILDADISAIQLGSEDNLLTLTENDDTPQHSSPNGHT